MEIDRKQQLTVRVKNNPLRELWMKITQKKSAEKLKKHLIEKYKLQITTRTMETYIYRNTLPLKLIPIFEEFDKDILNKVYSEMQEICYRNTEGGKTQWIRLPKTLTKELTYIAGALRDGYINLEINRITIVQKTSEKWLTETIIPIFQKSFNVNSMKIKEGRMVLYSAPIALFLSVLFEYTQGKQLYWSAPSIILRSDKKFQASYFQGYFDAEGSIDTKRAIIRVYQSWHKNEIAPSITHLRDILEKFGIKSNIYGPQRDEKSFISQLCIFCKENKNNFVIFNKFFGSKHPTKIEKLKELSRLLAPKEPRLQLRSLSAG